MVILELLIILAFPAVILWLTSRIPLLQNIGAMFCRDYATVIAAINSLKKQMEKDASLARRVQDIRYMLEA